MILRNTVLGSLWSHFMQVKVTLKSFEQAEKQILGARQINLGPCFKMENYKFLATKKVSN